MEFLFAWIFNSVLLVTLGPLGYQAGVMGMPYTEKQFQFCLYTINKGGQSIDAYVFILSFLNYHFFRNISTSVEVIVFFENWIYVVRR